MNLPIVDTLRELLLNVRRCRASLFRSLALPGTLIAALSLYYFNRPLPTENIVEWAMVGIAIGLLLSVFWALFAVSCHRVLLVDPDKPTPFDGVWLGSRQAKYILMAVVVSIPTFLQAASIPWFSSVWQDFTGSYEIPRYVIRTYSWSVLIPLQYLSSRIALTLPAAALRQPMSFAGAWALSKGNGWRLTAVLLAAPAIYSLISMITDPVLSNYPIVDSVVRTLVSLVVGILVIGALSHSYKWTLKNRS